MACGVPCIGTIIGGIPEIIDDGINGYLCKVKDIEGIAQKAIELLLNPTKYELFSKASMEKVQNSFSSNSVVGHYESVYRELLENGDQK
jgi:glycosyltransferase involved in cell wall biosynthesis